VFTTDAPLFPAIGVAIVQDGSPYVAGALPYAEWMPYQKGQAAKTEALEAKAAQPPAALTENDPSVPVQAPSTDTLPAAGNSTL